MDAGSFSRRIPQKAFVALLFTLVVVIIVLLLPSKGRSRDQASGILAYSGNQDGGDYNGTYPLTPPISKLCRPFENIKNSYQLGKILIGDCD